MNSCNFEDIFVFENSEIGNGLLGLHQIVYKNKPLFLILHFQRIMNSRNFEEIFVFENFEIGNGLLGLHQYVYLNLVQFLDSSVVRNVCLNTFALFNLLFFL
jgi:hypothetical protein